MPVMDAKPDTRKKWSKFAPLLVLAMAFPPFINSLDNPHLKGLRGPDVLLLFAIGFCVGGAFGLFMAGFVGRRRSS